MCKTSKVGLQSVGVWEAINSRLAKQKFQRDFNIRLQGTILSFKTTQSQSSSSQEVFFLNYWVNEWNWHKFPGAISLQDDLSYILSEPFSSINSPLSLCLSLCASVCFNCLIAQPRLPLVPSCRLPVAVTSKSLSLLVYPHRLSPTCYWNWTCIFIFHRRQRKCRKGFFWFVTAASIHLYAATVYLSC